MSFGADWFSSLAANIAYVDTVSVIEMLNLAILGSGSPVQINN